MYTNSVKLRNKNILFFGWSAWNRAPSVPEHILEILSCDNRAIYIEPFMSILRMFYSACLQRKTIRKRFGLRKEKENLFIYSPPPIALPFSLRFRFILKINTILLAWLVKRVMYRLNFKEPVLWILLYYLHGLIGRFDEKISIVECLEEEKAFQRSERLQKRILILESKLQQKADVVFVISPELFERKKKHNAATYIVPAGANYQHFVKANDINTKVPDELAHLRHPIVGYFGQIDPWKIDIKLLLYMANILPEWSIVLMGFVWNGFKGQQLTHFKNIHLIGPKPYDEIPAYIKGFDVCIMPFLINETTIHGDHLKLYEYLAAGKPVVSTAVPSAKRLKDLVYVSDSYEEFAKNVEAAYQNNHPELIQKRVDVAKRNSWDVRVAMKSDIILQIIQTKVIRGGFSTGSSLRDKD